MMRRSLIAGAACAAALGSVPALAQQPVEVVRRGLEAMGGVQAVRDLGGLTVEQYTSAFGLGQSELPESPPRASLTTGRVVNDWRGWRRAAMQETRNVAGAVNRQVAVLAGGIGAQGPGTLANPMNPNGVAGQERIMRLSPDRLLLAALDAPAALSAVPARDFRGQPHMGVRYAARDTVTLWFDRGTGLLTVAETVADDPVLGDRVTRTWYTRWQDAGQGIRFPRQVDAFVNGVLVQHTIHTSVAAAAAAPDSLFVIPDSIAARATRAPATPPPPAPIAVPLVALAPNVWRAEGGNHFTLIVDQGDQLLLVEAPISTQRMRAVLDTVRSRFPAKRIGAVVSTHHHWDHAGGLREVVAEGIPVVTHEANAAFVRRMAEAPRTVAPDLQSQRRRRADVRGMTDSLALGTGAGRVVVYRTPTAHAEGLVSVWVPSARILFTSDVLSPGNAPLPATGSAEMAALARARGIVPERYVGGHGMVVPWADVERAAGMPRSP